MRLRLLVPTVLLALLATACDGHDYVELEPTQLTLSRKGEVVSLTGRAMDRQGRYHPDVLLEWTSEDPAVASVDEVGRVTAVGSGSTWVTATAGDRQARAQVEVTLVERMELLDAEVTLKASDTPERFVPRVALYDAKGRPVTGRQIFLEAADPTVVRVDGQGGLWPLAPGETTVEARAEGLSQSLQVRVQK